MHLIGSTHNTLQLCQCMIEEIGRDGLSKMEFSLVLVSCAKASRVFRLTLATKAAFITSLFVLSAPPTLLFSTQHTTAHNSVPATHISNLKKPPRALKRHIGCTLHSVSTLSTKLRNVLKQTQKGFKKSIFFYFFFGCVGYELLNQAIVEIKNQS